MSGALGHFPAEARSDVSGSKVINRFVRDWFADWGPLSNPGELLRYNLKRGLAGYYPRGIPQGASAVESSM